jgi:hypothetical protein
VESSFPTLYRSTCRHSSKNVLLGSGKRLLLPDCTWSAAAIHTSTLLSPSTASALQPPNFPRWVCAGDVWIWNRNGDGPADDVDKLQGDGIGDWKLIHDGRGERGG